MLNSSKPRRPLSELEHLIMDFLWSSGAATAEQVREALRPRRVLKDSTVRTLLRRLEEKGYVKHRVDGRTYVYSGADAPQNVAVRAVRQIIERFCGGSAERLLVGMVDDQVIAREELERLARRLRKR